VRLAPRSGWKGKNGNVFGGTSNTATGRSEQHKSGPLNGLIALPKIRVHSRPFAVAFLLLPDDVFMIHHGIDFTPIREDQKTYRRLFGMIFFGGFFWLLVPNLQWFATLKISKNRQKSKANSIFISQNIDLPAKTP
jgi:hypothetical protein